MTDISANKTDASFAMTTPEAKSVAKRVFFGGTFDPVHLGHAQVAEHAWRTLKADSVSFVVGAKPPHKDLQDKANRATPVQRLAMVKLAVESLNLKHRTKVFSCDDREFSRKGLSYTVETLVDIRRQYPNDAIYWSVGMDSYNQLSTWHRWQELTHFANLFVVNRPGESRVCAGDVAAWSADKTVYVGSEDKAGSVIFSSMMPVESSSTQIRDEQAFDHVDPLVKEYIDLHQLY